MIVVPGLRRSITSLLSGPLRLLIRPAVAPDDVRARLGGRSRMTLYVQEERSLSDTIAITIACRRAGLRHPLKRLRGGDLSLPQSMVALERSRGVLRRRPDRRLPPNLGRAITAVTASPELDIDVVLVGVYWGRSRIACIRSGTPCCRRTGRLSARSDGCCPSCSAVVRR